MTILNRVAIVCRKDSSHQRFKEVDGACCIECESVMTPLPVTEEEYRGLPSYKDWCNQAKRKTVLEKLEKVFEVATERYISTRGVQGNLKEIESLGVTIMNFKSKPSGVRYPGIVPGGPEPRA